MLLVVMGGIGMLTFMNVYIYWILGKKQIKESDLL